MKPHSGRLIHVGINYFTIPNVVISAQTSLLFQQAILSEGLEFQQVNPLENQLVIVRRVPSPLEITIAAPEPQIAQILIVAPDPRRSLDLFTQEAEAATNAFLRVWSSQNRQIIHVDATIRELYETTSQHAFQELWESRLGQASQALATFGRPIRGGGLRFVMDPLPNESNPVQVEVKIESFLRDTSKIFVETQFTWMKPSEPGAPFEPQQYLYEISNYIETSVRTFIAGENKQNGTH